MQRVSASARVGVAMALSGVCSYGFLATASRALVPDHYARLATAWSLVYIVEPALFAPVAHVMARNLAAGRVKDDRATLRAACAAGVGVLTMLVTAALVGLGPLRDRLFDGDLRLCVVVILALPCQLALTIAWGFSAGRSRYSTYARLFAVDAAVRLATALIVGLSGRPTPAAFALAFVVGPVVAIWSNRHALRPPAGHGPARQEQVATTRAVAQQMLASSVAIAMLSLGPIVVKVLASADEVAEAGRLQNALSMTQAPLLICNALLVVLLPTLARHVAEHDIRGFVRRIALVLLVHTVIASIAVAVSGPLGPRALRLAFGPEYGIAAGDVRVLVAAAACFFGAQIVSQGFLALRCGGWNNVAYGCGGVTMVAVILMTDGLLGRVAVGFLAGTATAYAVGGVLLATRIWARAPELLRRRVRVPQPPGVMTSTTR